MRNALTLSLVIALGLSAGCIQTKHHFTLNPDGSGKVAYTQVSPLEGPAAFGPAEKPDPESTAKREIKDLLTNSQGVDAWKDVTYKLTDDGKLHITGTAYFADLNTVKIKGSADMQGMSPSFKKTDAGYTLTLTQEKDGDDAPAPDPNRPVPTDEQIKAQLRQARQEYQSTKPMMQAILSTLRAEFVFDLPTAVTKSTNFNKTGDRSVMLAFEGQKMLAAMDTLMNDDAWLTEAIKSGRNPMEEGPGEDRLNKLLFGAEGKVIATAQPGGRPQFDYAAEVAAAQKNYDAMVQKLGVSAPKVSTDPAGDSFKSVRVIGVRYVSESDNERGIRPFNGEAGYALAIMAELGGAAIDADEGEVTEATTAEGQSLLPAREFDRRISFPDLSEDRTVITFEVDLEKPAEGTKGLKKVAGTLTYVTATGTKEVDLGTLAFKAGAKGKALGAAIEEAGPSQFDESQSEVSLKLDVDPDVVKEVRFADASGKAIAMERRGYFGGGGQVTLSFGRDGKLPAGAQITVVLHDKLTRHTAGWSVGPVNLLGQPID